MTLKIFRMASAHACRLLLCLVGMLCNSAFGQLQDLMQVQRVAEGFAQEQTTSLPGVVEIKAIPLDPATRFSRCDALEAFLPTGRKLWGMSSVGVRCQHPRAWSLFVSVSVRVMTSVVVSSRPLSRGQLLTPSDVGLQKADLTQLPPGIYTSLDQVVGKTMNAAISNGYPLRPDLLRAPRAVVHGQSVRVVFVGEGFQVSSEGRALGNAAVGEAVQVRTTSGKVVKGIVSDPGIVEVR